MSAADLSESDILDTLGRSEYPIIIGHPGRRDLIDNSLLSHKFKYVLNRNLARNYPELLQDFADDLEDYLSLYGGASERYARMAQILAKGAAEHINGLIERLEYKESVASYHDEKMQEGARVALNEAARRQALVDHGPVEYIEPHGFHVYVLWSDGTPVYVGQSSNLFARLGAHMGDREKRGVTTKVQIIRCPDREAALALESELILQYRPRLNITGNPDARR